MKKILYVLLALAVVSLYSCKKENIDDSTNTTTQTPGGGGNGGGQDTTSTPTQHESFVGDWELMFAEGTNVHLVVDFNDFLPMGDINNDISMESTPFNVSIAELGNNRMSVTGSVTVQLMSALPVTFDINTTATLTESGLMIDPAPIEKTVEVMSMNVSLVGTATFAQPTAFPEGGVLTLVISSLDVTSNDSGTSMIGVVLNGTQLQASGSRVTE